MDPARCGEDGAEQEGEAARDGFWELLEERHGLK